MARPRKGDKPARTPPPARASLPRLSKSNKPNYKEDVGNDKDEPLAMMRTSGSSSTMQRRSEFTPNLYCHRDQGTTMRIIECQFREKTMDEIKAEHSSRPGMPIRTIFSLLIDMEIIQEFQEFHYRDPVDKFLTGSGWIIRRGIVCGDCKVLFGTLLEFGTHRGHDTIRPQNVVVQVMSLLAGKPWNLPLVAFQHEAWKKLRTNPAYSGYNHIKNDNDLLDSSDDSCIVCGDGGNLICCSTCPSTYHQECLKLQGTPPDNWKCVYCYCKSCGDAADEGRMLLSCDLCQKKYHKACFEGDDLTPIELSISRTKCCSVACFKINTKLNGMLGFKTHIDKDLSWSFIKKEDTADVSYHMIISNLKVFLASKIIEEAFDPMIDRFTKTNMVQSITLNRKSNFRRIDFGGFITAILENKDEIVSVASIRIHGPKLAEMPFIATAESWRGKGMAHTLLRSIEMALRDFGVEHMYVPSIPTMAEKWKTSYGFEILKNEVRKEIINTNCLAFLSTTRLQKTIQRCDFLNLIPDLNQDPPQE